MNKKTKRVLMTVDFVVEVPENFTLENMTLDVNLDAIFVVDTETSKFGRVVSFQTQSCEVIEREEDAS